MRQLRPSRVCFLSPRGLFPLSHILPPPPFGHFLPAAEIDPNITFSPLIWSPWPSRVIMWTKRLRYHSQFSSQYLPVAPVSPPRSPSRESSRDHSRSSRDPKSRHNDNPKRRSTMNSRDAAYDEEELLRRAIEESKEETRMSNDETSSRRTKRSRSDSEV